MDDQRELLKPADVAPRCGWTTGRVYQLIADGTIPAIRRGRAIFIPRHAFDEWLAAQSEFARADERAKGAVQSPVN